MSNQSLADTFSSTVKRVEKADKPGSGVASPPHFGDLGKAANDTFSKVCSTVCLYGLSLFHPPPSPMAANVSSDAC
jgi:hypothetical protein